MGQLINADQSQYVSLLHQLFTTHHVHSILTIPLNIQQEDTLVWPLTSTGTFTTTYNYNHLYSIHSPSIPSSLSTYFG